MEEISNVVPTTAPSDNIVINPSFLPAKMRILSGSALKLIACVLMLIDHLAAYLVGYLSFSQQPLFSIRGTSYTLYRLMRNAGRLAFPIYCFLIVEGLAHTKNRKKYGASLLLFAVLSEIPWNLVHGNLHYDKQNVFFTLFLGFAAMCLYEYFKEKPLAQTAVLFVLLYASVKLNADYNYRGYLLLLIMYFLRNERPAQALIASCHLRYEWVAGFAFLPINMYNGQRGFIRGKTAKYLFYAYYPVHLMVIYLIRRAILGA